MPIADLLVYGPCSNAGDVLIHQTFVGLFSKELDTKYHHIRQSKLNGVAPNIVIGPGGLLSGSYKPDVNPDELILRHMTSAKVAEWQSQGRRMFCFGTGTNTPTNAGSGSKPFSEVSARIIGEFVSAAQKIYLRGSADINRLQAFCNSEDLDKLIFQPCPSIFLDRIFDIKPVKRDRIALNLPFMKIKDLEKHPISRFVSYAHSEGLKVDFLDNHPMDFNVEVYDTFDGTTHSDTLKKFYLSAEPGSYESAQKLFQTEWESLESLPSRFNGYRFAFGARLHSFLPFMAFNTPSLFLASNPIRTAMPTEYFGNPIFGAKLPFGGKNVDQVVDGMIERLNYFIRHEDTLVDCIQEQRYRLWNITKRNKDEMLSLMT